MLWVLPDGKMFKVAELLVLLVMVSEQAGDHRVVGFFQRRVVLRASEDVFENILELRNVAVLHLGFSDTF